MALNVNTNAAASSATFEKAAAFINLYVYRKDGSKMKIGAIPLRESKNTERALIKRLQEEGAVDALLNALEVDFRLVEEKEVTLDF